MAKCNGNRFRGGILQSVMLNDPGFLRGIVERAVQQLLEDEMTAHMDADRHETGKGGTGHRNLYY